MPCKIRNRIRCTSGGVYVPCIYLGRWGSSLHSSICCLLFAQSIHLLFMPCKIRNRIRMYMWWSLCTLYLPGQVGQFFGFRHLLFADSIHLLLMPCKIRNRIRCALVEFMYHVFTWAGGTVLCIQVFAVCSEHSPLAYALQNLKQNKDVPVVEFMYLVFTRAGGTYSSLNSGICCSLTVFTSCLAKLETE